jgi:hypothetical protein
MTVQQVPADAPRLAHLGADALLYLHIGGEALRILSGEEALIARKGESLESSPSIFSSAAGGRRGVMRRRRSLTPFDALLERGELLRPQRFGLGKPDFQ